MKSSIEHVIWYVCTYSWEWPNGWNEVSLWIIHLARSFFSVAQLLFVSFRHWICVFNRYMIIVSSLSLSLFLISLTDFKLSANSQMIFITALLKILLSFDNYWKQIRWMDLSLHKYLEIQIENYFQRVK